MNEKKKRARWKRNWADLASDESITTAMNTTGDVVRRLSYFVKGADEPEDVITVCNKWYRRVVGLERKLGVTGLNRVEWIAFLFAHNIDDIDAIYMLLGMVESGEVYVKSEAIDMTPRHLAGSYS